MADTVTKQELIAAKIDVKHTGEAVNTKKIITPRYGAPFKSLPLAIQEVIETGGFEPFATEAQLKASVPVLTKKAAYALDTHKIWLWNNNQWTDTGLSAIDQAKLYADSNPNFKFVTLKNTDDLDDFKTSGTYTALSSAVADLSLNYPEKAGGLLRVSKHGSFNTTQQEYLTLYGQMYSRRYISSASGWSSWVKQATSAETAAAQAAAISAAAEDATSKADAAQAAAISAAAIDASTKADAAK
ncbi:hypothetical protein ENC20_04360, partial [Acinetobacter indicus]